MRPAAPRRQSLAPLVPRCAAPSRGDPPLRTRCARFAEKLRVRRENSVGAAPIEARHTTPRVESFALASVSIGAAEEVDACWTVVVSDVALQVDAIRRVEHRYGDVVRLVVLAQLGIVDHGSG